MKPLPAPAGVWAPQGTVGYTPEQWDTYSILTHNIAQYCSPTTNDLDQQQQVTQYTDRAWHPTSSSTMAQICPGLHPAKGCCMLPTSRTVRYASIPYASVVQLFHQCPDTHAADLCMKVHLHCMARNLQRRSNMGCHVLVLHCASVHYLAMRLLLCTYHERSICAVHAPT